MNCLLQNLKPGDSLQLSKKLGTGSSFIENLVHLLITFFFSWFQLKLIFFSTESKAMNL